MSSSTPIRQVVANVAQSTSRAARLTGHHSGLSTRQQISPVDHKTDINGKRGVESPSGGSSSGVSLSSDEDGPHYGPLIRRSAMDAARTVDQLSASAMGQLYNPMSAEFVKQSAQRVAHSTDSVAAQLSSAALPLSNFN